MDRMVICAEVGLQHCGCLGTAFAFVDAVADAGVDVAKFQCHDGDKCDKFRPGTEDQFCQDLDRSEYWERTGFTGGEWRRLAEKCRVRGLKFSCSVFSLAGLEMMAPLVDQLKIPSSKTSDWGLLTAAAITGKPVVISTGMSDIEELSDAIRVVQKYTDKLCLLQCASEYPTPAEHVSVDGLNDWLFALGVGSWGLSDHSGKIWPGIVAAWEGADMLEVHVTFSKKAFGPDVSSSLTIEELEQLVSGVRFVERMRASTVTKDDLAKSLEPVRRVFRG